MRRPLVALVLSCVGLIACEDGPTQTYTPAGPNAPQENNGNTPGVTDPGMQGFQTQGGGTNIMEICNAPTLAATTKKLVQQPLKPPRYVGLIDMAGGDTWSGLTIEAAEKVQCQSTNAGDQFGDGSQVNYWGDNGEMWCDYNVSNHLIYFCTVWPGYTGTMNLTSRDGKNQFVVPVNSQITKNGQPYTLDWAPSASGGLALNKAAVSEINELYDALTATYAPGLPQDPACTQSGSCIAGNFGDIAYMYFPALGVGWWIASLSATQPTPSIFNRIDMYLAKTLPYSLAPLMFKLDQVGPTALAGNLGTNTTPCQLQLGMTYDTFLKQCVNVTGDPTKDMTEFNKLLGGLTHGTESWTFDVSGVDINFQSKTLAPTEIVTDKLRPQPTDVSVNFDSDQSTLGKFGNDRVGNVGTAARDNHGAGLVYMEYARLVQDGLNKYIPAAQQHQLGDPACLYQPGGNACTVATQATDCPSAGSTCDPVAKTCTPTGVDPMQLNFPAGCTGFEGFITATPGGGIAGNPCHQNGDCMSGTCTIPAMAAAGSCTAPAGVVHVDPANPWLDALALGTSTYNYINASMSLGLKPGHTAATFCLDATGDLTTGYNFCNAPQGGQGDIFATSFARVLEVMGQGQVSNLPSEAQDVRFFWSKYVTALVKYFEVAGGPNENPAGVHAAPVDGDNIFFDSIGAGQFEIGEYVDRRFASKTQGPTDLNITADVKNGIFDEYQFSRELTRGETALYTSVLENQSDGIGQENSALLTNLFGSQILQTGWKASSKGKSAYYCATTIDPANCDNQLPPLDAQGNLQVNAVGGPRLARYPGAFAGAQTPFSLYVPSANQNNNSNTVMKVTQTFGDIQQAMVSIPLTKNPYDPNSMSLPPMSVLIPWTPKQPGSGFPVALTGTLDKFVETSNLDFSGTTITASVDYDCAIDNKTMQCSSDGSLLLKAVETTDFLGEVFMCQDAASGDILGIRMYTPVATILKWLNDHPGNYQACGIVIKYSPFGNYADYITSLTNGLRVNITQGGGYGRVVDVTMFTPGQ